MVLENIEIILSNLKNIYLEEIINNELGVKFNNIISSHFYDKLHERDIEYSDLVSLRDYYLTSNTGYIFVKNICIEDVIIQEVMIIMSFDDVFGDIVLNFKEKIFFSVKKDKLKRVIKKMIKLQAKYEIEKIRIGFEPATDDDMLLALINKNGLQFANKFNMDLI